MYYFRVVRIECSKMKKNEGNVSFGINPILNCISPVKVDNLSFVQIPEGNIVAHVPYYVITIFIKGWDKFHPLLIYMQSIKLVSITFILQPLFPPFNKE